MGLSHKSRNKNQIVLMKNLEGFKQFPLSTFLFTLYCFILTQLLLLSCFSHVRLFATLWTVAHQAPLSMGFSRQEYWSGLPCPPLGGLPNPGIEPHFLCPLHWQVGFYHQRHLGSPVLIIQQYDSVIYMYTHTYFFSDSFPL